MVVREGVAVRRAARGRPASARSTSSSPPTKARAADRSTATRCTGGSCEDAAVGHRLHGSGVGAPLGRGPLPRAGRDRSARRRAGVGPDRAARTRRVEGGRRGTTPGPAPRRRRALRTPDRTRDRSTPCGSYLTEDVMPGTTGRLSFHARVAANMLAIVERELAQPTARPRRRRLGVTRAAVRDKLAVANPKHLRG